ncbi:hypothetical protein EV679_1514 [Kerstersia gyiorum]|uniref:Restriction endonuclease n=2 Tax=Kerstersia gyiorum TaxID=206506 RepID=A0A4Q7MQR3_9BURK|nr:hypothetical protein EV679_1514 [Kerstersia gyiorum]
MNVSPMPVTAATPPAIPYVENIRAAGLSIYDPIAVGDPAFWIPTPDLEKLLDDALRGQSLAGLPLRTRSKVAKQYVCTALGYPLPPSFRKVQPRFPGQLFDTYVQKANNLQVWNEELSPSRRYVLIRVNAADCISQVRVVTGDTLAQLDTTGTLTQKYQARCLVGDETAELVSLQDTTAIQPLTRPGLQLSTVTPVSYPTAGALLPVAEIYQRLAPLVGSSFPDLGADQERNRGAGLHALVCRQLGYQHYLDDGQFPDVRQQLLEVKLQTSPTIDLGLALPSGPDLLDVPQLDGHQPRHCDVRYAVFYARTDGRMVTLTHLIVSTGEDFFTRFTQFQGKGLNKKLQIPLPAGFFRADAEHAPDLLI